MSELVTGINDFTFRLFSELSKKPGNVFCSPKNVADALAMVYVAAKEQTKAAMEKVCGFTDPKTTAIDLGKLNESLTNQKNCLIRFGNGLWPQKDFRFKAAYMQLIEDVFGAAFELVDYKDAKNYPVIAKSVNDYVSKKTDGMIPSLVTEEFFNKDSVLTLVSSIYFFGKWKNKFDESQTKEMPFTLADGTKKPCQMMKYQGNCLYLQTPTEQVIDLPYEGDELRMLVVLPTAPTGVKLRNYDEKWFEKTIHHLRVENAILMLSKWKAAAEYDLIESLTALGMGNCFGNNANFRDMMEDDEAGVKIGKVVHKAIVDVTEAGTKAAAATAVNVRMLACAMPTQPPKIFKADRPFDYFIWHQPTKSILFAGRQSIPG